MVGAGHHFIVPVQWGQGAEQTTLVEAVDTPSEESLHDGLTKTLHIPVLVSLINAGSTDKAFLEDVAPPSQAPGMNEDVGVLGVRPPDESSRFSLASHGDSLLSAQPRQSYVLSLA